MMMTTSTTPAFNLKVVVAETGIKADTLRAWERRYGLPQPQRSKGKHRLYSQYDLEVIKWLIARQAEGMSISRAVNLWRQMEEEGKSPLLVYGGEKVEGTAVVPLTGNRVEELRQSWIDACYQFNETAAEQVLAQAFAVYPPETVCLQVLMQGLAAIGSQWYADEATVQQEHFASALAMRRLHTLLSAAPPATRRERIIVACPPQEDHAFAPLLLTLMLRYRGWDVIYLGTDVPHEQLETALDAIRPHLIVLTAQQLHTAATLASIAGFLQEQKVQIGFGGLIFNLIPTLHTHIPGHFLGARLEDTPHLIEDLIRFDPPAPNVPNIAESYRAALSQFRQQQSQIDARIWQELRQTEISYKHLVNANRYMARNINAALSLGNMDYIGSELDWLKQLLANYQWPPGTLQHFLSAYHEASDLYLNGRGRPIVDWLAQIIQNEMVNGR